MAEVLLYNLIRARVSGPSARRGLCCLLLALSQPRELLGCGSEQGSRPPRGVNFPLGPLPELEHFCKIWTNQYFCKEPEDSLGLLPS